MAKDTGLGGTVSFGTSGFTGAFTELGGETESVEDLDTSHLGTTGYMTFEPGDLKNAGEFSGTLFWDAHEATASPTVGVKEIVTRTYPNSGTSAATLAGSAYVKEFTRPAMQIGQLMQAEVLIKWADGPTFTVGT